MASDMYETRHRHRLRHMLVIDRLKFIKGSGMQGESRAAEAYLLSYDSGGSRVVHGSDCILHQYQRTSMRFELGVRVRASQESMNGFCKNMLSASEYRIRLVICVHHRICWIL